MTTDKKAFTAVLTWYFLIIYRCVMEVIILLISKRLLCHGCRYLPNESIRFVQQLQFQDSRNRRLKAVFLLGAVVTGIEFGLASGPRVKLG